MKSVVLLWETLLVEVGSQHRVRTSQDLKYARSRLENEGLSFLTISLPAFEKDFLNSLSLGQVQSNHFAGYRKQSGGLPRFLGGFLSGIFTPSGALRDDADARLIRAVRQILLFCSKIELPTSPLRNKRALDAFVTTDAEVADFLEPQLFQLIADEARVLFGKPFGLAEQRIWSRDWTPKYSAGATAERASYNERFSNVTWTERMNEVIPYWDDLVTNYNWTHDVHVLPPDQEPPVRIALVPKTMKTPRIIAMEPSWMQYSQQGVMALLTEVLRDQPIFSYMGWLDQTPNRDMARLGSENGEFATLDLSEASDRVSYELFKAVFHYFPYLRDVIDSCRSRQALLPDGRLVTLKKFASMGSAMTFPLESIVFHILVSIACRLSIGGRPGETVHGYRIHTRVYGDDLIVPETVAPTLVRVLETFGLKVNAHKSFTTGLFRESCGSDWYRGHDVSILKLRHPSPDNRNQFGLFESAIDLQHRLYESCYWETSALLGHMLKSAYPGIAVQAPGIQVPCVWEEGAPVHCRLDDSLHEPVYKAVSFRRKKPTDPLDGYGALKKFFSPHGLPREKNHLQADGRSQCVGVNTGWSREA